MQGIITLPQLKPHIKGFSDSGKAIARALAWFNEQGQLPPYSLRGVDLACHEALGLEASELENYLAEVEEQVVGEEIKAILDNSLNKLKLLDLQQAIVEQMTENSYDPLAFQDILTEGKGGQVQLVSLDTEAQTWEDDDGTAGIRLGDELKTFQTVSGGLRGFWVIGGNTGAGKSTLAWQLALHGADKRPVLYYDMENTKRVLYERTVELFDGNRGAANESLRRVFVRNDPRTVWRDVQSVGEAAIVVIDSLQKLPASVNLKRETVEQWLARLDMLKLQGHIVIVVSQLNRGFGQYKGTNDIEHTADFGLIVSRVSHDNEDLRSEVYVEKNRHGNKLGYLTTIHRTRRGLLQE